MAYSEDKTVSAENGYLFAEACRKAGVPYAHHVFAEGGTWDVCRHRRMVEQKLKERPDKWTEEEQAHIYGALDEVGDVDRTCKTMVKTDALHKRKAGDRQ